MLLIAALWLVIAIVVGVGANGRGRSGFGWFLLAVFLSPLIAGLLLVVLPDLYVRDLLQGPIRITEVDDRTLQRNVERGQKGDLPRCRGCNLTISGSAKNCPRCGTPVRSQFRILGRSIFVIVALLILSAFVLWAGKEGGTWMSSASRFDAKRVADILGNEHQASPSATTGTDSVSGYASVASLPCMNLLNASGRGLDKPGMLRFSSLSDPVAKYVSEMDGGLGSAANITDYMLTECRLNENYQIGEAVNKLFDDKRRNRLPRIPIGGATNDPQVQADWDAFDKWIHHQGPPPILSHHSLDLCWRGGNLKSQQQTDLSRTIDRRDPFVSYNTRRSGAIETLVFYFETHLWFQVFPSFGRPSAASSESTIV